MMAALRTIPPRLARRYRVVPLRVDGATLVAGCEDPDDVRVEEALARLGHDAVRLEPLAPERLAHVLATWYGPSADLHELARQLADRGGQTQLERAEALSAAPAVRFVDLLLRAAIAEGASDIHLDADPEAPRLRFRIDGVLLARPAPPGWLAPRLVGRLRALARLELGERPGAQDGRFSVGEAGGPVDVRVSIIAGERGDFVVLRLLPEREAAPLETLGVVGEHRVRLLRAGAAPDGLIVFAGPTGSGKTTTLHALLGAMDCERRNVVSIEEPVEIRSRRLRQIPVRREVGLDFAGALRVVLRQDPDVILVGETRDAETASLVVQAALAGHLVLTTVHASNVFGAFERLARLGADPAALAETLRLVASQRLVRRLCARCGGRGCFLCEGTGHRGRTAVLETLVCDGRLRAALLGGRGRVELEALAREGGYRSLWEHGLALVREGVTSREELERVLGSAESWEAWEAS